MAGQAICCGECSLPVPPESWNRGAVRCRGCGQTIMASVFPALEVARVGASPEALEILGRPEILDRLARPGRSAQGRL